MRPFSGIFCNTNNGLSRSDPHIVGVGMDTTQCMARTSRSDANTFGEMW